MDQETYQERIGRVQQTLAEWGVEALLVGSPANRRWLSGFTGSAGWLLITAEDAALGTDSRYWEQAQGQAPACSVFRFKQGEQLPQMVQQLVVERGLERVGIEARHVTLKEFEEWQREVKGVTWLPLPETVEPWRAVKTAAEIAGIRAATAITDQVMASVGQRARLGQSEAELAWELEKALRENGADEMAFDIIVASGPNSALPHHHPGQRRLQAGDPLIVDMGAALAGYRSDLTRTFYLGDPASEKFWEIYQLVLHAENTTLDQLGGGLTGAAGDALARDVIEAAGYGDYFGHGLGHGVGLEIHEGPSLSRRGKQPLPAGSVVTVEPGVYLPGWGGVRLEDLVLLTEKGLELLSHCPKEPLVTLQ